MNTGFERVIMSSSGTCTYTLLTSNRPVAAHPLTDRRALANQVLPTNTPTQTSCPSTTMACVQTHLLRQAVQVPSGPVYKHTSSYKLSKYHQALRTNTPPQTSCPSNIRRCVQTHLLRQALQLSSTILMQTRHLPVLFLEKKTIKCLVSVQFETRVRTHVVLFIPLV